MPQAALVLTVIAGKHKLVFSFPSQEIGFLNYPEQIVEQSQFLGGEKNSLWLSQVYAQDNADRL